MAPTVDVDLNAVVEKPLLPAGQPFTFITKKADMAMAKKPNKKTGKIEPYIACECFPIDPGWEDRIVYHNWSLAPGALESPENTFSIKKFFQVVGFQWGTTWSTEDVMTIRFVATVKYKEGDNRPQFDKILRAA